MGERALVAVTRPDGRYDLYHAQWGASDSRLRAALAGDPAGPLDGATPLASAVPAADVPDRFDPREYELLYVLGDGLVAYLVCWLGVETRAPPDPAVAPLVADAAALVPLDDPATAARLRRFLRAAKGPLGEAVDAGALALPAAIRALGAALSRRPDVPEETVWLPLEAW